jgi:phosphoribosylaminoimidazole-succinocarboxamide synthase
MQAVTSVDLDGLEVFSKGKVREVYDLGERLLIVASDRISAFDHVLPSGIPDKGKILTAMSAFWFRRLQRISAHHMITEHFADFPDELKRYEDLLSGRSMLAWKARRIDVECIVRGYLAGSAWKEYSQTGRVAGVELPVGLGKNDRLEVPLFTPSTKSDDGHDHNITIRQMCDLAGSQVTEYIMAKSMGLYDEARRLAEPKGITLLDTKFEFGYLEDDLILIDEVLTPDSSRFLVQEGPGSAPVNLDKQFIRDYLETTGWDKNSPPPPLPDDITTECRRRYLVMLERLIGGKPTWAE